MPESPDPQITFNLDGREVSATKGEMVIAAAERAGTFIPRFCYHPRMEPVGVCRMCLVEIEGPRGATLQPACFIGVNDGMVVTTDSEKVKKAQDGVLELLLTNHPLDCPVCDKGGECPLQDQTLIHGPGETRFVEEKRHFEKPIAISELVLLDRERCIQCSRCTRFAAEVAGDALIDFAGRGDKVEVATFPTEPFDSYFSGNTVQICPVGALTASPYRFAARPWDLEQVESTCTGCSVGCRVAVQSSGDRLTRLLGVDSDPVNHSWLCDKGRFSFEAVNGPDEGNEELELVDPRRRLTEPMVLKEGQLTAVSWGEALTAAGALLSEAIASSPSGLGAIGGAQLTNEGAYAWARLLKGVLGTDSVDAQLGDGLDALHVLGLPRATLDEAAAACTVVVLAGDLREELPVLFLRLRAGAVAGRSSLIDLGPRSSSISSLAAVRLPTRPGDAPAVAAALAGEVGSPPAHPAGRPYTDEDLATARALLGEDGEGVVFVVGRTSVAEDAAFVEAAARTFAARFPKATFLPALRRANVFGALDMGLSPGLLPGRTALERPGEALRTSWATLPAERGRGTLAQLAALAEEAQKVLLLLGADPLIDVADASLVDRALSTGAPIIAVTGHGSPILDHATVVLPAAVAHERTGTTTNLEGRVSRLGQKVGAPGQAWTDWMIAAELAAELGADLEMSSASDVTDQIARLAPSHHGLDAACFESPEAVDGVLAPHGRNAPLKGRAAVRTTDPIAVPGLAGVPVVGSGSYAGAVRGAPSTVEAAAEILISVSDLPTTSAPEAPAADSYSLRLVATRSLYDLGAAVAASPSLSSLRPEAVVHANPYDLDRIGAASGEEVTLRSERATLVVPVVADEGVLRGTLAVAANLSAGSSVSTSVASALIDLNEPVCDVRIESL